MDFNFPLISEVLKLSGCSLILTMALIFGFDRIFRKAGFMDHPERYPHEGNRAPIPYGMGIVLFVNFVALSLIFLDSTFEKLAVTIILGCIITVVSFLDDLETIDIIKMKIDPVLRLFMQIGAGAIVGITSIKIGYVSNIFGGILRLDSYYLQLGDARIFIIPLFFTIVWYVLVFNSINWSDVIPGLTSGLVGVSFLILLVLTVKLYFQDTTPPSRENSEFVLSILAIMIPSVFIFWLFDVRKSFLIGDSGTMFLAFMIATLAIISGGKIATVATVLGMYIIDAFYVILMRLYNKKNPLKGDTTHHLHFRLGKMGFSQNFIRNLVYSLSFIFGISAIFLDKVGKIIIFVTMMIFVFFVTNILAIGKGDESSPANRS